MSSRLDVVGIGSMVVDRMHRPPRLLGADEKGILGDVEGSGPVGLYVGGVILNQLGWAATLGVRAGVFGRQAEDEGGRFLRSAMAAHVIETHLDLTGSASSVAEIFVDDAGERAIYMARGATAETTADHVRKDHADFIETSARLTTEVSQLPLDATLAALEVAGAAGLQRIVDLDVPPSDATSVLGDEATLDAVLRAADLLKPSSSAAQELIPDAKDSLSLACALRARYGNDAVVLTDGADGCAISTEDFEGCVPAYVAKVVDTTGAGDAFLGGLVAGLARGLDWENAARLANAAGAACVEQLGAFPEQSERARARVLELYDGKDVELPGAASGASSSASEPGTDAGRRVLDVAARELDALAGRYDSSGSGSDSLLAAARLVEAAESEGKRVHVTGIGKPEHVAHYALHGSLGQVIPGDVVIAISNSGTTSECLLAARALCDYGARLVAVTGNVESPLGKLAEVALEAGTAEEGGPLGLAPRSSVLAEIAVFAALGAVIQERRGFTQSDYAARHPAGALGKQARGD